MVTDQEDSGWACLMIDGVPRQAWAFRIDSEPKVIGRDVECEIPLLHVTVSRRHAEIWSSDVEIFLRDLDSRNGSQLLSQAKMRRCEFAETESVRRAKAAVAR